MGFRQELSSSLRRAVAMPGYEAGEHLARVLPADVVEQLERLVAEVEDVAGVQIDPVRGRGEDHVGYLAGGYAEVDRCAETPLGALVVTDLDEAAEPSLEDLGGGSLLSAEDRPGSGAVVRRTRRPPV